MLSDVGQAARWSRALEEQLITPGPLRVGSRRRAVVPTVGGRTMENEMELTELEQDRRLAMRGVAGFPFPVRIVAELEPADGGALLRWTTFMEPGGVAKLLGPLLAASYDAVICQGSGEPEVDDGVGSAREGACHRVLAKRTCFALRRQG